MTRLTTLQFQVAHGNPPKMPEVLLYTSSFLMRNLLQKKSCWMCTVQNKSCWMTIVLCMSIVLGCSNCPESQEILSFRISGVSENSDFPDVRKSEISGFPESRISGGSGYPDSRVSGFPDLRVSKYPDIRRIRLNSRRVGVLR